LNKKLACIFACLISLVLSLAHYVNFIVVFPGSQDLSLDFFRFSFFIKSGKLKILTQIIKLDNRLPYITELLR